MKEPEKPWRVLGSRMVYDAAPWIQVFRETVETGSGQIIDDFHRVDVMDFALVFAWDEQGRALLLRQWRQGPRRFAYSFPGGHVEPGEEPAKTAVRELLEETGYAADGVIPLGRFSMHSNLGLGWGNFFFAKGARRSQPPGTQDLETAEVHTLDAARLDAALKDGQIATVHDALCAHLGLAATA